MTTQSVLAKSRVPDRSDIEPLPDPPRKPEMNEYPGINAFISALSVWFRHRDDVLIGSSGYLWRQLTDRYGPYPDVILAVGVRNPRGIIRRNGYVISEVGKPPDLVLEVGSRSTGRRDYTVKRETYAEYAVREYWRFDPSGGKFHDTSLAGDTLVDGKYVPIEIVSESETRHWGFSEVLGLELWWDDGLLRLRDPVSGEFIRTNEEAHDALESERAARLAAEARQAEMESELRRLRIG